MTNNKPVTSWFGIALVIIGGALLLTKLNIIDVRFSTIFWVVFSMFGLLSTIRGFSMNIRWKIFWGTLCFLYGLYFFLRASDLVELRNHIFLPVTFVVFGVAFLMMFLNDTKEWFFVIPALFLGGAGTLFILADLDYFSYWDMYDSIHRYWPLILIILGLGFIFRRRTTQSPGSYTPPMSAPSIGSAPPADSTSSESVPPAQ